MTLTIYLILSLTGAGLLGFGAAWFWQSHQLDSHTGSVDELKKTLQEEQATSSRLQAENETQKLSIENLQKLMQNLENQCFSLEQKVQKVEFSSEILRDEKHRLMAELDSQIRENEVMREMPELDLDVEVEEEEEGDLDLRTKAKKLVRAFKKGYQQIDTPPPTSS